MTAVRDADTVDTLVKEVTSLDATILLFRSVPSFELEFAALEMEDDLDLTPWDEAVMALAAARGAVTPHDVDAYLGLEEDLSAAIVENLAREHLLAEAPAPAPTRHPTQARLLKESGAPDSPLHVLTEAGTSALARGRRTVRFRTHARLVFWERPLRFIDVESERNRRYGHHYRDEPLRPEDVPPVFRTIDDLLALPPAERLKRIGIEGSIPGLRGRFIGVSRDSCPTLVGVEPGKTWEVRRLLEQRNGLLVVAGFASSIPEELQLRTLIGSGRELRDDEHLPAHDLPDVATLTPRALCAALRGRGHAAHPLVTSGAFPVRVTADAIGTLLGRGEAPIDTLFPIEGYLPDWTAAVRLRALPADRAAAERAFFTLLGRKRAALRANLERACLETAAALRAYWGEPFEPPPMASILAELWKSRDLRSVICERRLEGDLMTPYGPQRAEHRDGEAKV